jgi:uncharacterized protein (DUF362 family)
MVFFLSPLLEKIYLIMALFVNGFIELREVFITNNRKLKFRIGERSYPLTFQVMEQKGIRPLLKDLDVHVVDFDTLDKKDWVKMDPADTHWRDGFRVARPVLEAECLISTGCLKTHQFGGVFTLSLKLHVGVVPTTRHGFDYMTELHTSPHQNKLIAEINQPFQPDLILIDGIDAFNESGLHPMPRENMGGRSLCQTGQCGGRIQRNLFQAGKEYAGPAI